ncbi:MAG: spore maturation protein [Oscillospiraceae bacterium]
MKLTDILIPLIISAVLLTGLVKKVDVWSEFVEGAKENFKTGIGIIPTLIAIITAVGMFKASGGMNFLTSAVAPATSLFGFPAECAPLAIIKPISGSAALAVLESILRSNGADSFAGRVASVMMGSSETTFYVLAVYFGATKIKNTRHALFCALLGDLTGMIMSAIIVSLLF